MDRTFNLRLPELVVCGLMKYLLSHREAVMMEEWPGVALRIVHLGSLCVF